MQPDGSSGTTVASGDDIPNIDPVRKMVRAYYNAPSGTADKTSSPYLSQMALLTSAWSAQVSGDCATQYAPYASAVGSRTHAVKAVHKAKRHLHHRARAVHKAKKRVHRAQSPRAAKAARQHLAKTVRAERHAKRSLGHKRDARDAIVVPDAPAAVFDADDTTLWNYDLEDGVLKFVYNPATAAAYVSGHKFPAVPGMISVVRAAQRAGCAVYGLTGRPASQQADTVANLAEVGFLDASGTPLFSNARFFTKDVANQPFLDCGADRVCSTIEYKSGTRAHIEDAGFDIVGNFGDQYSDLLGGYADHVYKVPNPTYYLP